MKKQTLRKVLALVLVCVMALCLLAGCGGDKNTGKTDNPGTGNTGNTGNTGKTDSKDVLKMSFSHHDAATSIWGICFEDWADEVDKAGLTDITVYAGATLAAPADGLNALRTGVCDILWTNMAFFPGQFPVTDATILPMINNGATADEATQVLWDLWEDEEMGKALRDEWSEFKILIMHGSPGFPIGLAKAGSKPSDLAGRTLRAPAGGLTELMSVIGANPVLTPSGDIYTSMDKGIIEGYNIDYAGIAGFKLQDVTNFALDLNTINQFMVVLMKKDKFDALPADVQAALEAASGREASITLAKRTQESSDATRAEFESTDRLIIPTEGELAEWEAAAEPVHQNWITKNTSADFDAQAFYDNLVALFQKYTAEG